MHVNITQPLKLIDSMPEAMQAPMLALYQSIYANIPEGFEVTTDTTMIHFVVPHTLYPDGYHCTPNQPLPFISIAAQKHHIALYHFGIMMFDDVRQWFEEAYARENIGKLDMGKSCIRFKHGKPIPYELLGQLCQKIQLQEFIDTYENVIKKGNSKRKNSGSGKHSKKNKQ